MSDIHWGSMQPARLRRASMAILLSFAGLAAGDPLPDLPAYFHDREPFYADVAYPQGYPSSESLLGHPLGEIPTRQDEAYRAIERWTKDNPRARLVEVARTYRDLPVYGIFVSAPGNIERLNEIRDDWARLADPRGASDASLRQLAAKQPLIAWFSYSVHGNETSGLDAGLAMLERLTQANDAATLETLERAVLMLVPLMNPDGREAYDATNRINGSRNRLWTQESSWEFLGRGRHNHYDFDLNRDWILGVMPETRGRLDWLRPWHPLLFVDVHEMTADSPYMTSPPREPKSLNLPRHRQKWMDAFAAEKTAVYARHDMKMYTGEWLESFYPGYGESYGSYRSAVTLLYEARRTGPHGGFDQNGRFVPHRNVVRQQAIGAWQDLQMALRNREPLVADFLQERREALAPGGRFAQRSWAVLPTDNARRLRFFVELCGRHGFELHRASRAFAANGRDFVGRRGQLAVPAGSLVLRGLQPEAHLLRVLMEFEAEIAPAFEEEERRTLLRGEPSKIDDSTAWNLPMQYGLPTYELDGLPPSGALEPWPAGEQARGGSAPDAATLERAMGLWIDGADDASVIVAARLMQRGAQLRVALKAGRFDGVPHARGSVFALFGDNPGIDRPRLAGTVRALADEGRIAVHPLIDGNGGDSGPDVGGYEFPLLRVPRVALIAHPTMGDNEVDYGANWFLLDQVLGIRHAQVAAHFLGESDLGQFDVLLFPDGKHLEAARRHWPRVRDWVRSGGTLITVGRSTAQLLEAQWPDIGIRTLPSALPDTAPYAEAALADWLVGNAGQPGLMPEALMKAAKYSMGEAAEAVRADAQAARFMPHGVILAGRVDQLHWLTFGTPAELPIDFENQVGPLLATADVQVPVRFGLWLPRASGSSEPQQLGWNVVPPRTELRTVMSGFVFPQARQRLGNSAALARQAYGNGQIIAFASSPNWRGSRQGTARLMLNAVVYSSLGVTRPWELKVGGEGIASR